MDLTSKEVKSHVSVNDICVKPNHYTLPIEGEGKYKLEAYYAQHVDDVYPEVYELLINTSISKISNNQKHKILNTLLSLYFRTPKVLKSANKLIDDTIDKAVALTHEGQNVIKLNMDGRKLTFTKDQIDEIKKTEHEINHRGFLLSHLELWHEFVAYKYNCGILVYELEGDVELITSDFPVIINGPSNQRFHLFNPDNMIQIPIDRKHYVMIAPNCKFRINLTPSFRFIFTP